MNKRYIVLSMPTENLINVYRTINLELYQQIPGDAKKYQNIGENIQLVSNVLEPAKMEVHNLFYSSVNFLEVSDIQDPSKQNARIGLLQMFHPSEHAPFPQFFLNNYAAFSLPLKSYKDELSSAFSFDIRGDKIISKSSHDNYFEIGSFCANDQKFVWRTQGSIQDNCSPCDFKESNLTAPDSYIFSRGNQDKACHSCEGLAAGANTSTLFDFFNKKLCLKSSEDEP